MRPVQKKMNVRILKIMRILRTDLEEPVRTKRVVGGGVLIHVDTVPSAPSPGSSLCGSN